jgi:hypothetical protein
MKTVNPKRSVQVILNQHQDHRPTLNHSLIPRKQFSRSVHNDPSQLGSPDETTLYTRRIYDPTYTYDNQDYRNSNRPITAQSTPRETHQIPTDYERRHAIEQRMIRQIRDMSIDQMEHWMQSNTSPTQDTPQTSSFHRTTHQVTPTDTSPYDHNSP